MRRSLARLRNGLNLGVQGSAVISPTAHYTGYVWVQHAIAPRELATTEGAVFYRALQPLMAAARLAGRATLEDFLLARHRLIDQLLSAAIDSGEVGQVLELASGLSPRGYDFARRYGAALTYVDSDLPAMAETRRRTVASLDTLGEHHQVVELDVLDEDGLAAVAARLDPDRGLAVVSEGLLNYLPEADVRDLWRRIAGLATTFPTVRYLSDLHVAADLPLEARIGLLGLDAFVRGTTHLHFPDAAAAETALRDAGFTSVVVRDPTVYAGIVPDTDRAGARLVRVVDATAVGNAPLG